MATSIEDLTECAVCKVEFVNPQILPCQHTFCKSCIYRLIARKNMTCPICKGYFEKIDVKPDFNRVKFLEVLKAKNVAVQLKPEVIGSAKCELCQKNQMSHMCDECEQFICSECRVTHLRAKSSRNHTVISLKAQWNKFKLKQDVHIKALQDLLSDLEGRNKEFSKFDGELRKIEDEILTESQYLRGVYLKLVNDKFDKVDKTIRIYKNNKTKQAHELVSELNAQIASISSRLRKINEDWENKDTKLLINKESSLLELSELQKTKIPEPLQCARIKIKQLAELNIDKSVEVVFDERENTPSDISQEVVKVRAAPISDGPNLSLKQTALTWEPISSCNCISIHQGIANRNRVCSQAHILKLQQEFNSGTHLLKITLFKNGHIAANIGVVSNKLKANRKAIKTWMKPFLKMKACSTNVYMMLCLEGRRCLKFRQDDDGVPFEAFRGELPKGPLCLALRTEVLESVHVYYVHDLSVF